MRPCPSCGWMLQESDPACNMCGAAIPGAGGGQGVAPPPAAMPAQNAMGGGYPPPPVPYGAGGGAGAYAPPPPPAQQAGAAAFSQAADVPIPMSPWAQMAPRPMAAPAPAPSFGGGMQMQPLPPAPPGAPMGPPMQQPGMPMGGGYPPAFQPPPAMQQQVQAPMMGPVPVSAGGMVGPPPMVGGPAMGQNMMPAPPPMIAPPPIMAPSFGAPGGLAQPPPVGLQPPPMAQHPSLPPTPGVLSGPSPQPTQAKSGVLVGFLVTFQNEPSGAYWAVHSGRTQIGRAGSDKVEVGINDASASSRHASIHADPSTGQAYVEDEGSRNGTFLNERKLTPGEQRQLHDNDRLRLGSTTLVVKLLVS